MQITLKNLELATDFATQIRSLEAMKDTIQDEVHEIRVGTDICVEVPVSAQAARDVVNGRISDNYLKLVSLGFELIPEITTP